MKDCKSGTLTQKVTDPYKRVNYPLGLVLGVDEFDQEQAYLMERDRLHNRALHGYGTVCGLDVAVRDSSTGPEVMVSPGLAVNPVGQKIRVPTAQCARLNAWLARNQDRVRERFGSPPAPGPLSLYVVLCYRECETDTVPIPGGPCRSEDDSMAPSRIADDFKLSLCLDPPTQVEEDVGRLFGELLGRIEITAEPGIFLTHEDMKDLVRGLIEEPGSPPLSPPPGPGSPPDDERLRLHPDEACDILRAAFRVWVTEVRPRLRGDEERCSLASPDEPCVLLGELVFDVTEVGGALQVSGDVSVNQDQRPVLLHTRLLQEWLLCGRLGRTDVEAVHTFVTLLVQDSTTIRAWIHHPALLDVPPEAVTIEINDAPSGSPPELVIVTQPMPDVNVFDLGLSVSLADGERVSVRFDAGLMTEATSPAQTLLAALEGLDYAYVDRDGDELLAYLAVDLPALDDLSDVNALPAVGGEVLTWDLGTGKWIATPPSTDVTDHGALTGLGDDDHPQYHDDARGDARYAPIAHSHTGFVQAPAGPYAIVAAGFFNFEGEPIGPTYNDLEVVDMDLSVGDYVLRFGEYIYPPEVDHQIMYIVKGTVQDLADLEAPRATFQFVDFEEDGIRVRILNIENEFAELGFMVEISMFGEF